jgi:low affinity Fe/Cu permease
MQSHPALITRQRPKFDTATGARRLHWRLSRHVPKACTFDVTGADMNMFFRKFAHGTAELVGSPWAFILGLAVIGAWGVAGPIFNYSDTWQLIINTSTTVVTFLIVFLIQNTQNRDAKAIHLKLDELIRGVKGARTEMVALETCTDEELAAFQKEFEKLHARLAKRAEFAAHAAKTLRRGPAPDGVAE